ncbi:MAG TPA: DM9 repeat-containing protein [Polyangiaceae bacterium]
MLLACALGCGACAKTDEPFSRTTQKAAEGDENPGYVWFHRKPGQPLPGARFEAGFDVKAQFGLGVCRARHAGSVIPGRTYGQRCSVPIEGKEVIVDEFDALVARAGGLWHIDPREGQNFDAALVAGRDASGKHLFSCVAAHVSGWLFKSHHGFQPGVYRDGKCEFAFDGEALTSDHFYVLATAAPRKEKPLDAGAPPELDAGTDAGGLATSDAGAPEPTRSTDAGVATRDAASDGAAVDGSATDAASSDDVPGMEPEPELPFPPAAPAVCIEGEVPCPCERYNGCSRAGLCICRL